ncbi:MAG: response regulator transcription factor [Bacteroidota bacterium]
MPATTTRPARVLVVDDHPIVRHGIAELISMEADLEVCGLADEAYEALQVVETERPDVSVIDISIKGSLNGIELIKMARSVQPDFTALVLSIHQEAIYAERALRAGAKGYLMKDEATGNVVQAIRDVLNGQVHVSKRVAMSVLRSLSNDRAVAAETPVARLSDREFEVFQLIGAGYAPRHIAEELHVSVRTVETHRERIKIKLHLEDAAALTRYAVNWKQGLAEES